jgi:hypothetical protein
MNFVGLIENIPIIDAIVSFKGLILESHIFGVFCNCRITLDAKQKKEKKTMPENLSEHFSSRPPTSCPESLAVQKGFLRHDALLYWKLKTEMKDTQFPLFVKARNALKIKIHKLFLPG